MMNFEKINLYFIKIKNFIKIYCIYFIIILILNFFIYFSFFSGQRLVISFLILMYIYIYKFLIYLIKNNYFKNIYLNYPKFINYVAFIFFWSNPILSFLLYLENHCLVWIKDNNKHKKLFVYILFIFIINPIKFIFFKYYNIYYKWKTYSFLNITTLRIIGLITSVLIITQIVQILINYFSIWIYIIIYLLIALLIFVNEKLNFPWYFKFLVKKKINLYILIKIRIEISILGQLLDNLKNFTNMRIFNKYKKLYNIDVLRIFNLNSSFFIIKNYYKLRGKPLYRDLGLLDFLYKLSINYIPQYIFFKIFEKDLYEELITTKYDHTVSYYSRKEILENWNKIKLLFEYRYLYHKILLFRIWDIEEWLGYGIKDNVDNSVYKNIEISGTYNVIEFEHSLILKFGEEEQYYKWILEKSIMDLSILSKIKEYDILQFEEFSDSIWTDIKNENELKFKQKCINIFYSDNLNAFLQENWMIWGAGPEESYIEYINNWYKEWSTINDKEKYYIQLLEELDIAYKNLQIKI